MAKNQDKLNVADLLKEVEALRSQLRADNDAQRMIHDLEVYREEARAQTEQLMEAHHLLEQSRDRYAELYDYAPLSYVTLDHNGVIKEINLTGAEMLGIERSRILETPFLVYVQDSDRRMFLDHMRRCNTGRGRCLSEISLRTRDSRIIPVQLLSRHIADGGANGPFCLTIIIDLTERKRAEQALRESEERLRKLNEVLEQRTAEAEHRATQLRALASELTQVEQRERRRLAQVLHDDLQQTLVAAKMRIAALRRADRGNTEISDAAQKVDELLGNSIETSRSLTLELSPPVLYEANLSAALHWLARRVQEKHDLRVDLNIRTECQPAAQDVRVLLFHALQELLFNIVKHAGVHCARVTVDHTDSQLRVRVEDDGKGFNPDTLMKPGSKTDEFGLFNIQQRLVMIGGRLEIDSAPGQGTRVTIVAPMDVSPPVVAPKPVAAPRSAAPATVPQSDHGKTRVLLADDHKILREGLAGLLREQPQIEVVGEAADGQIALEMARQLHPDVVVMDISMPRMNGIEATRSLTAEMPDVKVIGLSMHEESDMAAAIREAGAVSYLTKGGPYEALVAAIHAAHPTAVATPLEQRQIRDH